MLSTGQRFISSGQHYPPFEQLGPDVNSFTVICLGQETCVIKAVHVMYTQCFFYFVFHLKVGANVNYLSLS